MQTGELALLDALAASLVGWRLQYFEWETSLELLPIGPRRT